MRHKKKGGVSCCLGERNREKEEQEPKDGWSSTSSFLFEFKISNPALKTLQIGFRSRYTASDLCRCKVLSDSLPFHPRTRPDTNRRILGRNSLSRPPLIPSSSKPFPPTDKSRPINDTIPSRLFLNSEQWIFLSFLKTFLNLNLIKKKKKRFGEG